MDVGLFIAVMAMMSAFYLLVGWSVSKTMTSHVEFFFADRQLGVMATTATLLATQIGGGMFIGTAEDPFRGILYVLGIVISFIVLGLGIAEKFREFNVETVSEIFERRYNSKILSGICIILSVATLCGILLSQTIAMKSVIGNFSGAYADYVFPGLWIVILAYTLLGGLKAVVAVDLVQIVFVMVVFTLFFLYSLFKGETSFVLSEISEQLTTVFAKSELSMSEIIRITVVAACYSIITQDVAQRFFSAKNKSVASKAAFYASIILFAFAIVPFYFGIKAHFLPQSAGNISPLFAVLAQIKSGFPLIIAMCALMAAITSTVDSLVCAVASIVCSLGNPFIRFSTDDVLFSQIIITICGVFIFAGSYFVPQDIISTLIDSYEISVACLFVPIIAACVKHKNELYRTSAYLSVGLGFFGFVLSKLLSCQWLDPWALLISLGLSLLGYILGDLAQQRSTPA